ncbi:short chain dehydrogenase [Chloropicon primus]|uniref:Short chain dehydrogenase n=1 Tax=Chloropicon primus TaxID=1764295 RepID=A0A5B8MPQ7_9CHLO|nr:short chain dehydrogenase [Chloropicon primus]UPR01254.1 short chain dehydrogenase [Chloropicon primus]|eukprot:QDZ22034.1 short chain dehydrogenase [Chloropicon primus]
MVLNAIVSYLVWKVAVVLAAFSAISFAGYVLIQAIVNALPPVDLKKRYKAEWALVTGASSGIGKSLAVECAKQGLNVCLVALPDEVLSGTYKELKKRFKRVEFREIGVNLGKTGYLAEIEEATKDISVQVVFANAGYMLTGFFIDSTLDRQLANIECNAISSVSVTHHFVKRMVSEDKRGCVVYTSSAAACMPSPFTALYSATKSFISAFAAGLAAEVKSKGVDVCVVHPSPVATRFYDKAHKMDMLDFFKNFACDPDTLPEQILKAIGRTVWVDIGTTAIFFRMMMKIMDYNFLSTLLSNIAHMMPDFKRHDKKAKTT